MDAPTDVPREPADWRLRFVLAMLVFILGLAIGHRTAPFIGGCVSYVGIEIMLRADASGMGRIGGTVHVSVAKPVLAWIVMAIGVVIGFVLAG